jgi:hypothetical protein
MVALVLTPVPSRAEPPAAVIPPAGIPPAGIPPAGIEQIAESLAHMLQAARSVISDNQALIDDPTIGNKGLTGAVVLSNAIAQYRAATGTDPLADEANPRAARLLRFEMDSIAEVVDANQDLINARGVAFKAFIPAVFARLVGEAFHRRAGEEASIKVTAPPALVRNRKSLPDAFESSVIRDRFLTPAWPRGQSYETSVERAGHQQFRMLVPEYYAPSCLACHGSPKGSLDITGYPREGASPGDLGGVISVTVAR